MLNLGTDGTDNSVTNSCTHTEDNRVPQSFDKV